MIEINNVKKSFGSKVVLDGISAEMETGKCNLIIGASGSGKTVLTKCMVGLIRPDEGEILFDEKNMTTMAAEQRKELRQQLGMLFQGSALFDSMTVAQNVMFPLDMFSKASFREKRKKAIEVLERVQLRDAQHKFPAEISGGMKKEWVSPERSC